jgi:SecD/SecF fusion protein
MPWYANLLFAEVPVQEASSLGWVKLLVAVAVLAVSFFLGSYLGKKLRMPDHGWKITLVLFTLLASVAVLLLGPKVKLGVDLSGGAILVYEVDQTKKEAGKTVDMEQLLDAIKKRVNPGGQKEVTIRTYGKEQVEVIIPEKDEAEIARIERIISQTGSLEFHILANNRDDKELIERALAEPSKMVLTDSKGKREGWWVPVKEEEVESLSRSSDIALRRRPTADGKATIAEVLLVPDDYNVTGAYLSRSYVDTDERGQWCVRFNFNSEGGELFGHLTNTHLPDEVNKDLTYKLGIVLDGTLYSAPSIQSTIFSSGQITGTFTKDQVQELVNVLNAGSLPAELTKQPISKLQSGATLGEDTIHKSTRAMIIASILVPLFMFWYYHISGLIANIALVLNMLILFAVMLAFKAAFTLTGFAGLALTVGMAVDNNVLVYERLREELDRGATLRMAIRNAFHRAGTTIIDCNCTHMIAAIVLWCIGSDQLKGFAVTLLIGVVTSMYTSVFVSHLMFEIAEKRQWLTKIKMLRLIGHTKIDFMHWFPYCFTASLLITVMALVVSVYRGVGLFDIDFTGGVSVQVEFKQPQETDEVRKLLGERPESERLKDLAITDVRVGDQEKGLQFVVNTSEPSMERVQSELTKVFGDKLAHNAIKFTPPEIISTAPVKDIVPPAKEPAEKKPAEPAKKGQSRRDLPLRALLASTETDSLMLALADPAKPAEDKTAKPAEDKTAKPAKGEGDKAAEKPGAAEPVELPDSNAAARKRVVPEAAENAVLPEKPAARPDPFANGSRVELEFVEKVNHDTVKQLLDKIMEKLEIPLESTPFDLSNDKYVEGDRSPYSKWTLKIMLPPAKAQVLLQAAQKNVAESPVFPASSKIGGAVADKTRYSAVFAITASWICIIIYLWIRFQGVAFGLAAVIALVHDVFVMLGAVAVSIYIAPYLGFLMVEPFKINLPIVAAFLTIIGYSVNDTIVVFDRIREVRGKDPNMTREMVNSSTNQTLSRTLLTSFTVLLVVIVLYFWGGDAIHGFAFALVVGVLTGTYSSVYVAAPILLWLVGKRDKVSALIER